MGQPIPGSLKQRIGLGWDMGHIDWHVFLLFYFSFFKKIKIKIKLNFFNFRLGGNISLLTILQVVNKCY